MHYSSAKALLNAWVGNATSLWTYGKRVFQPYISSVVSIRMYASGTIAGKTSDISEPLCLLPQPKGDVIMVMIPGSRLMLEPPFWLHDARMAAMKQI